MYVFETGVLKTLLHCAASKIDHIFKEAVKKQLVAFSEKSFKHILVLWLQLLLSSKNKNNCFSLNA